MYDNPLIVGGAALAPAVLGIRFTRAGERLGETILAVTGFDPLMLVLMAVGALALGLFLLRLRPKS